MEQNRWKSYILWMAVASLISMGLVDAHVIESTDMFDKYVDKLMYILILLGIVNNPKDKSGI